MSIEERLTDAILDLQGLLAAGMSVQEALVEAAGTYALKPDVLRIRASKALGELGTVGSRAASATAAAREEQASKTAIREYADRDNDEPAFEWLRARLGRVPTHEEHRDALGLSMERWLQRHLEDFQD